MGVILLDTSVLVDHARKSSDARQAWERAFDEGSAFCGSVVTKVELLAGMRAHEKRSMRELMDSVMWLPVLDRVAQRAGEFARKYRASHQGIGVADFMIAATADHFEARLWTTNVKHFPMFPDLGRPY